MEAAGWKRRVVNPLKGRRCAGDAHYLAVEAHALNFRQRLMDFHADGGAVAWNWRTHAGQSSSER